MNSNQLREVFKALHKVFPVPTGHGFNGIHGFTLNKDGNLELGIWVEEKDTVKCWSFTFDDKSDDLSEDLFRNELAPAIEKARND